MDFLYWIIVFFFSQKYMDGIVTLGTVSPLKNVAVFAQQCGAPEAVASLGSALLVFLSLVGEGEVTRPSIFRCIKTDSFAGLMFWVENKVL